MKKIGPYEVSDRDYEIVKNLVEIEQKGASLTSGIWRNAETVAELLGLGHQYRNWERPYE